ncbi:PTS sugar transporter subunit IIC [Atopobium sp. oral taxon 199]|uniref:PTS sugar transporter subunit IIC n=1 Tax=Atopobium sp. oral taxon 199 TaxID=712156 RepID=UPI00054D7CF4|nr:PTS sugar transporter subunit IIC [Atopobium sp. oral taxon 199]
MEKFEKKLMPLAEVVSKNKYLLTMRDSFAMIMPLLIIGSIFTLIANFPIAPWMEFLKNTTIGDKTLASLISIPAGCTVSFLALFLAFAIGYNFAPHIGITDRASAGFVSLVSWLILMPQFTEFTPEGATEAIKVASVPLGWVGAKGVFIAIVVAFCSVKIFGFALNKNWTIKMPEGVPPTVARAFSALIPMTLSFTIIWAVAVLFVLTPFDNAFNFVYKILQMPLQTLGGTVIAQTVVYIFAHILWFFGIHGTNVTDSVYAPILTALSAENQAALAVGQALPNIINLQFQNLFATFGGGGSTLSLLIIAILTARSERIKKLSNLSILPGIFGINEPVIFGLPIILNPILFIPFLLVPTVNIISTWAVMKIGLVPLCNGVMLPWTTPPVISGFLVSGWQGAVWQIVLIVIGCLIYFPFVKALDDQYLKEDAEAKAKQENANFTSMDLDSIDLDAIEL